MDNSIIRDAESLSEAPLAIEAPERPEPFDAAMFYEEIRDSVMLSMKAEGVDEETREAVLATVDDAVGNF